MTKFKSIFKFITGRKKNTKQEVCEKSPWLEEADFEDAEVDISKDYLIWKSRGGKNGRWKSGRWKSGKFNNAINRLNKKINENHD